jgi:hypothetical protein
MKRRLAAACLLTLACAAVCAAQKSGEKRSDDHDAVTLKALDEEQRNREYLEHFRARPGEELLPAQLKDAYEPAKLPEGKDAWVVQVVTRGGFTGRGRGDITLKSDGAVSCGPTVFDPCAATLSPASLESLSKLVSAANPLQWKERPGGLCSDCYVSLVALQRRDAKGRGKSYLVYFDDTTLARMPEEVRRMYARAFELASPPK